MSSDQHITLEQSQNRIQVIANGEMVAESNRAIVVLERGHGPVIYLPPEDVSRALFKRTGHSTRCPFKGDATYWTISAGGQEIENAAWSYEDPIPQVAQLKGYFSFYTDKVDVQTG